MKTTGGKRFYRMAMAILLLAVLFLAAEAASAASYEKVYGVTTERIRVRDDASLSAPVVDNLHSDRCVYILDSKTRSGTTFVRVQYRAAEGKLEKGWAAQKSGGTTYIEVLSSSEAKDRFGVSGGKLPSDPAGTMSAAERAERRAGESAEKTGEDTKAESGKTDETDENIREAQEGLKTLGYYWGEITGHAGSKTVAALEAFQKDQGIRETGKADSATRKALREALKKNSGNPSASSASTPKPASSSSSSSGVLKLDSTGRSVTELQKNLTALGYYYGDLTGHYGEKTARAVRKYQEEHGMKETGEADRALRQKIAGDAKKTANKAAAKETSSPASSSSSHSRIYNLDWFRAKENGVFSKVGFSSGRTAKLQDLSTRKTLDVRIQSSGYHLDVEPLTEKDTQTLCAIYGVSTPKEIDAERRPMLLTTAFGYRIVCSCYGTPHGTKIVSGNGYPGQFCLHFLNSKTSGSGRVDNGHQAAIRRAVAMVGKDRVRKVQTRDDLPTY